MTSAHKIKRRLLASKPRNPLVAPATRRKAGRQAGQRVLKKQWTAGDPER